MKPLALLKISAITLCTLLAASSCCNQKELSPQQTCKVFVKEIISGKINPKHITQVTQTIIADKENYLKYMPNTIVKHTCGRPKALSMLVYHIYQDEPKAKDFVFNLKRDSISKNGKTAWVWFTNSKEFKNNNSKIDNTPTIWVIKLVKVNDSWLIDMPMID